MTSKPQTTYVHTCDLCGVQTPREELSRFGLVAIVESTMKISPRLVSDDLDDMVDVCTDCIKRPIEDLLTRLKDRPERDRLGNVVHTAKVRLA